MPKISALPPGTGFDPLEATGTDVFAAVRGGVTRKVTGLAPLSAITTGPIVILAMGQSNMEQAWSTVWEPASNAQKWNWDFVTGNVGTAFEAIPDNSIQVATKVASDIGGAYPNRDVRVINISKGGENISHWMVGASSPDLYADTKANVEAAIALLDVSHIDMVLWWQGESQTSTPETYVDDFNTVMSRFQAESWWPQSAPVVIFGISPASLHGDAQYDVTNARLQQAAREQSSSRLFVYTGDLPTSFWDVTQIHVNEIGTFAAGEMASNAILYGMGGNSFFDPVNKRPRAALTGRGGFRNLIHNGDFTSNSWRYGTTFTAPADGDDVIDGFKWRQTGAGVVDILRTADAPTIAQAGQFTQHCLHADVTTADASIGATDYYGFEIDLPAQTTSLLGFGQTGARNLVVSFWVKATVTGNYFVAAQNSAQNRYYVRQFVIGASDTWEKKSIIFPGDTAGTWLYTSGIGVRLFFTLAAGDNFLFTPDTWGAADVRVGNVTRANGMSSTSNNFKLALMSAYEGGVDEPMFDQLPQYSRQVDFNAEVIGDIPVANLGAHCPIMNFGVDVDFNTVGDYPITVTMPPGVQRFRPGAFFVCNTGTTASLTTAQFGVFSAPSGGGVELIASGTALSAITQNSADTDDALAIFAPSGFATGYFNVSTTTIYFRVTQAQGAAASGRVTMQVSPMG